MKLETKDDNPKRKIHFEKNGLMTVKLCKSKYVGNIKEVKMNCIGKQ